MRRPCLHALLGVFALACGPQATPLHVASRTPEPREPTALELEERARSAERARAARRLALRYQLEEVSSVEPGAGHGLSGEAPWPRVPRAAGPSQVAVWRDGEQVGLIERTEAADAGLMVLDVGTEWVPALFRSSPDVPHAYEPTFSDLANGRFADDPQGRRARRDRYLELYGIPSSPALLARRFAEQAGYTCAGRVPRSALREFEGADWSEDGPGDPGVDAEVVAALQERLACEGHLRTPPSGHLDSRTRSALEEFERRNRIYARGSLRGQTLEALRASPLELERRALLRTFTERLLLDLGVIEDGSAELASPRGAESGRRATIESPPNVVARIERAVANAFGLHDVDSTSELYRRLRDVFQRPHYHIAIPAVRLPSYYGDDMELFVEIDRGDVYYDFPYDDDWKRRDQPITEHPTLTLFARKAGTRGEHSELIVPLTRYGTTIGGWRMERRDGRKLWTYKESPVGSRVWEHIVSAPVWLPPAGTPPETLVYQTRSTPEREPSWEVNDNLVGPGYASAYGLVAAYHERFEVRDGRRVLVGDEGIRSHGSSDYTSIWQSASHGCHRLHNHLAIRLFNFILAHRAHRRVGHRTAAFRMPVSLEEFSTVIEVSRTGYAFELQEPIPVEVLRGQVRGDRDRATKRRVPVQPGPEGNGPG